MNSFSDFNLKKHLINSLAELKLKTPTPIQVAAYAPILAGRDFVGIAQTGTGKTIAYLLPILQDLKYSEQLNPRVLILAPTRELVIQIVEQVEKLCANYQIRVLGVYGGSSNIKAQKRALLAGADIIVGTPRRLYDLTLAGSVKLSSVKKVVIDEVDIMLDFGYKTQLNNIFEQLPAKHQNILFSATMTSYVDELIDDFLINPLKETISISGTPLTNIRQQCYSVPNFYTKVNLLNHLLQDRQLHSKVLIFVGSKVSADLLFEELDFTEELSIIHSGKEQNFRTGAIEQFSTGKSRILIATDVIARGIDIDKISTVISFDTPFYPENYIHRIGRTGRAGSEGAAILLYTTKESPLKEQIEQLMNYVIPEIDLPESVAINPKLSEEEKPKRKEEDEAAHKEPDIIPGKAFHEKKPKNNKPQGVKKSYDQILKDRFKKPIRRGDKIQNKNKKRK